MTPANYFNFVVFNLLLLYLPLAALILWRKPGGWLLLQSIFIGFIVGWWDMHSTEVSASIIFLLTFSLFAGYAQPRRAWLLALTLGGWIPVLATVGKLLTITSPTVIEQWTALLALGFTFLGAYAGALLRRFAPPQALLEAAE